jgi:hypothetical protein
VVAIATGGSVIGAVDDAATLTSADPVVAVTPGEEAPALGVVVVITAVVEGGSVLVVVVGAVVGVVVVSANACSGENRAMKPTIALAHRTRGVERRIITEDTG